ncbi:hypothetical protein [Aquisediminimonas profunda]|uniref:hypothetical protein n=1 Tax=Aquisediminimonas profunda TaxID=1550733 RepID=UPI001C6314EE|nr:hypothetical protein [Aquisediminimonas profunda]
MTHRMRDLANEIVRLQGELDREIEQRRKALGWNLQNRLVEFEHGIVAQHRRLRLSAAALVARAPITTLLTAPVIYSLILPLVLIDIWASIYQRICFPVYKIPLVQRSDFIAFDRQHLAYLNWIEALNCGFCGYANGLVAYLREISSRTEQYWCPIKHAIRISDPHSRYRDFLEYGDAAGYRERLERFREALREPKDGNQTTGSG